MPHSIGPHQPYGRTRRGKAAIRGGLPLKRTDVITGDMEKDDGTLLNILNILLTRRILLMGRGVIINVHVLDSTSRGSMVQLHLYLLKFVTLCPVDSLFTCSSTR